jgi:hypothetical protein
MRNLFSRLPSHCHTNWEIAEVPLEARVWDSNTYMLANILDAVKANGWYIVAANSKRPPKPPKPFKRPEIKKKKPAQKGFWPGKTIVDKG